MTLSSLKFAQNSIFRKMKVPVLPEKQPKKKPAVLLLQVKLRNTTAVGVPGILPCPKSRSLI